MKITIYYPANDKLHKCLQEKISIIHAQAVAAYIKKLNCTKDDKETLIKELCRNST